MKNNTKQTVIMCIIYHKIIRDNCVPQFIFNGKPLNLVSKEKYLGYMVCDDFNDDEDLNRQMRSIH